MVSVKSSVAGGVAAGGLVTSDFGLPPPPLSLPPPWPLPPPVVPPPAVAPPDPAVVEARRPAAALTGAAALLGELLGVGALSSTLPSTDNACPVGQTLNETRPTRVTKTMAAPASRAPDAPMPTMKLSGVLLVVRAAA